MVPEGCWHGHLGVALCGSQAATRQALRSCCSGRAACYQPIVDAAEHWALLSGCPLPRNKHPVFVAAGIMRVILVPSWALP